MDDQEKKPEQELSTKPDQEPQRKSGRKLSISLGALIVLLASVLIVLIIGYKYNEYKTIKKYVELYNSTWDEEFRLTEDAGNTGVEFAEMLERQASESAETITEQLAILDEQLRGVNLVENIEIDYYKTIQRNRDSYSNKPVYEKLIFGKKGEFLNYIRNKQLEYYETEIEKTKRGLALTHYLQNFYSIVKDTYLALDYESKGAQLEQNYYDNFNDIKVIEKYTKSDFKFENEEEIKQYYPDAFNTLTNYKNYLSSYYSVYKDFVAGDTESAAYKYEALADNSLNLGLDWEQDTKDPDEDKYDRATIEVTRDQTLRIKEFERGDELSYPIIGQVGNFEDDLVACQLYGFKSISLYFDLKNEYPDTNDVNKLLELLSEISPKTDELDKEFDRASMTINNEPEQVTFTCLNSKGSSYTFKIKKENEDN